MLSAERKLYILKKTGIGTDDTGKTDCQRAACIGILHTPRPS